MTRDFRMVKLDAERFSRLWPNLKDFVNQILITPQREFRDGNILTAVQSGRLEIFLLVEKEGINVSILSLVMIGFGGDFISQEPSMIIYGLASLKMMDLNAFRFGLEWLKKYSKARACESITAITRNRKMAAMCRKLGASTEYSMKWRIE